MWRDFGCLLLITMSLVAVVFVSCSDGDDDDVDFSDDDFGDDDDNSDDDSDDDDSGDDDDDDDDDDDTQPDDLTVLTINLQNPLFSGNVEERTQIVADLIDAEQPDMVAVQEVTQNLSLGNRAEALAEMTGYDWTWVRTHTLILYEEGIGILARGTIRWSDDTDLPHPDLSVVERRVLGVTAETQHGEVTLYVSHMTTASDEEEKADQAWTIREFINELTHAEPVFFAGDLNAEPDTLAMRFLRGEAEHEGVTGDYTDSWIAANGDDPGYTHPSEDPEKRIDYIYRVPVEEGEPPAVIGCERVLTEPVDGIRASDHVGVLCRFELTGTR